MIGTLQSMGRLGDLRQGLDLRESDTLAITHLTGEINQKKFHGHGIGKINFEEGYSDSEIELFNFPETFSPMLCSSWKCKNHITGGGKHDLPDGLDAYQLEVVVEYSKGARGLITTTGDVRRIGKDLSMCYNTFHGNYEGPVEVDTIYPFTVNYRRINDNSYQIDAIRTLESKGVVVEAKWSGILKILSNQRPEDFANEFVMEDFAWKNQDGKAYYRKLLSLRQFSL